MLRLEGAPAYRTWEPEQVVDPVGFRMQTVERRLRRDGEARQLSA